LSVASGPGTFGELDSTGARSVLRRYSDAHTADTKGTATWSRPPTSPPATAAAPSSPRPPGARRSRTAEPGHTCQACTRHDV